MKRIKKLKGWGIFENNKAEIAKYGFHFTVLYPDNMEYSYMCSSSDTDIELGSLEAAIDWIENY